MRLLAVVLVALFALSPAARGQASKPSRPFNGVDLAGWSHFAPDKSVKLADVWAVKDGAIHCVGKPNGYLKSDQAFKDYVLKLQWRWPVKVGNSGVFVRVQGPDKLWPKCIEVQLKDQSAGDIHLNSGMTAKVDAARTVRNKTTKLKASNEKPQGEWNDLEVRLDGGGLEVKINGEVQNTASEVEPAAGAIALQSEGAEIEFRNIEITPLGEESRP